LQIKQGKRCQRKTRRSHRFHDEKSPRNSARKKREKHQRTEKSSVQRKNGGIELYLRRPEKNATRHPSEKENRGRKAHIPKKGGGGYTIRGFNRGFRRKEKEDASTFRKGGPASSAGLEKKKGKGEGGGEGGGGKGEKNVASAHFQTKKRRSVVNLCKTPCNKREKRAYETIFLHTRT